MVPQPLAALDQAEIADDAVIAATHASEPCPPEMIAYARQHPRSMHSPPIPSNLDVTESSTPIGRSRIERGDGGDYALYRDQLATRRGLSEARFQSLLRNASIVAPPTLSIAYGHRPMLPAQ